MVVNRQSRIRVAIRPLEQFLGRVQQELGLANREVTVCLVSDPAMARLNQGFRGKRGPTDVLSFPADGTLALGFAVHSNSAVLPRVQGKPVVAEVGSYLGDIAIAPATARRNTRRFGRTLPQELRILILHGVLHLAGYDHETDRGEMDRLERRLRRRLGLD